VAVPEVEVCVLGPIVVRGAALAFDRAASRELVAYLAMHPRGASTDSWATALWPERTMAAPTLYSTASSARRALGRSRLGGFHLPKGHTRLRLAPSVSADWWRFAALVSTQDPSRWAEGLALVRGRPFEGLRCLDWPILEGFSAEIEESIVMLATKLADARLAAGDGSGAAWAARRGLLANPYDERLYRRLLRAADLEGNQAGLESTMARLLRLLGGDVHTKHAGVVDLSEVVHPETADLYRALSGGGTKGCLFRL
jgi:DNA-binding SARP family transcriptional activator